MNRLEELLSGKDSYLLDNETIIYISNEEMVIRHNGNSELVEISGQVDDIIINYISSQINYREECLNYGYQFD